MKYTYWIVTVLFCAMMVVTAAMYFVNYDEFSSEFIKLGFPTWLMYPLAALKILGAAVILIRNNRSLVEWAYAGFVFNILLAFTAHLTIADGDQWTALTALLLALGSYFLGNKVRPLF
ncbi:DoxX family protein [Nonlabens antarcticus]|uniref:DoxX family protein n=1 Tax=Nonlabens antarcticus TaxID=392714 RepID=UPI001891B2A5|nr:DoxX family protein [Nonlabens antarcticus]